jgi:signal transduction histidine kinase
MTGQQEAGMARMWGKTFKHPDTMENGERSPFSALGLLEAKASRHPQGSGYSGSISGARFYFLSGRDAAGLKAPSQSPRRIQAGMADAAAGRASFNDEATLKLFTQGVARHINDLLMGLLGQCALCRLDAPDDPHLISPVKKMEGLVQFGAHLTVHLLGLCGRGVFSDPPFVPGASGHRPQAMIGYACERFRSFPFYHLSAALGRKPFDADAFHAACRQLSREYLIVFDHLLAAIGSMPAPVARERTGAMRRLALAGKRLMMEIAAFAGEDARKRKPTEITRSASVARIIRRVVRQVAGDAQGLKVTVSIGMSAPSVDMLPADFRHVMAAVVKNAVEAMPNGGALTVTAISRTGRAADGVQPSRNCLEVAVSDTGTGIPDDAVHRMYHPFFTLKEADGRFGLGLTGALGRIQRAGGSIDVSSVFGTGTIALIRIPAASTKRPALDLFAAGRPISDRTAMACGC